MQVITRANDIRTSTRKIRIVADAVRNLGIEEALDALSVINKRGAHDLEKALKSAVANAVNNSKLEKNNLRIAAIDVNEGTSLKRFRPSTRGRIHRYKKRSSNIRIVLEERASVVARPAQPAQLKAENKKEGSAGAKSLAEKEENK